MSGDDRNKLLFLVKKVPAITDRCGMCSGVWQMDSWVTPIPDADDGQHRGQSLYLMLWCPPRYQAISLRPAAILWDILWDENAQ